MVFNKDNTLQDMILTKIQELENNRISHIHSFRKPGREESYILFLGSYMTNAQLFELELYQEASAELGVRIGL